MCTLTVPLSTQEYKINCQGNLTINANAGGNAGGNLQWTSIPSGGGGGVAVLLVASCCGDWDKLLQYGPLGSRADVYLDNRL